MEKLSDSDAPKTSPCHMWESAAGLLNQHKQRASEKRGFAGCMKKVTYRYSKFKIKLFFRKSINIHKL